MTSVIVNLGAVSALLRIFAASTSGEFTDHQAIFAFVVMLGGIAGVNIWYANAVGGAALAAGYYDLIEIGPQTWTLGVAAKGLGVAVAAMGVIFAIMIRWPFLFAPVMLSSAVYLSWDSAHILNVTDQAPSVEYLLGEATA